MFTDWQLRKFEKRRRIEDPDLSRSIVLGDPFLLASYKDILHAQLSLLAPLAHPRTIVELGSSGGITKLVQREVITTDVRQSDGIDCILNVDLTLPFASSSVSGIIAKDVLHHISDPESHFMEIKRVLKSGGMAIYVEPNWNFVSRVVFTFMHPEPFESKQIDWKFKSQDPMYSNQALPYIIFVRDVDRFKSLFPELEVVIEKKTLNGLSFLLSGGVMQRTFLSHRVLLLLKRFESKSKILMVLFGTSRIIKITKRI
jgi:SAM-dependent methyltransferase